MNHPNIPNKKLTPSSQPGEKALPGLALPAPNAMLALIKQVSRDRQVEPRYIGPNHYFYPTIIGKAEGFDLSSYLSTRKGRAVEIGGPSRRYDILQDTPLPDDILISNIHGGDGIDAIVNARYLPFPDKSLGALFTSYLPKSDHEGSDLRQAFLQQAARKLEMGGLLVLQGTEEREIIQAETLGFVPVILTEDEASLPATGEYVAWSAVLAKVAEIDTLPSPETTS